MSPVFHSGIRGICLIKQKIGFKKREIASGRPVAMTGPVSSKRGRRQCVRHFFNPEIREAKQRGKNLSFASGGAWRFQRNSHKDRGAGFRIADTSGCAFYLVSNTNPAVVSLMKIIDTNCPQPDQHIIFQLHHRRVAYFERHSA